MQMIFGEREQETLKKGEKMTMRRILLMISLMILLPIFVYPITFENIWYKENVGQYNFNDISTPDHNTAFAVGNAGLVMKRTSSGWANITISGITQSEWDFNGVWFYDNQKGFIVGAKNVGNTGDPAREGIILRTINGGGNWTKWYSSSIVGVERPVSFNDVCYAQSAAGNRAYVVGEKRYILRLPNSWANNTWEKVLNYPPGSDVYDNFTSVWVVQDHSDYVWISSDNQGKIYRSNNYGNDWDGPHYFDQTYNIPDPETQDDIDWEGYKLPLSIYGIDYNHSYVSLSHGKVGYIYELGGQIYTEEIDANAGNTWLRNIWGTGSNTMHAVGTDGVILKTDNAWTDDSIVFYEKNIDLRGVDFSEQGWGYSAGWNGDSVMRDTLHPCIRIANVHFEPHPSYYVDIDFTCLDPTQSEMDSFIIYRGFEAVWDTFQSDPVSYPNLHRYRIAMGYSIGWTNYVWPNSHLDYYGGYYHFIFYAKWKDGHMQYLGNFQCSTTGENAPITPPNKPYNKNISDVANDQGYALKLTWSDNNSPPVDGFFMYRSEEQNANYQCIDSLNASAREYTDKKVIPGKTYYYLIYSSRTWTFCINTIPQDVLHLDAVDNKAPQQIAGFTNVYVNHQTDEFYAEWDPIEDSSFAGYFFCPTYPATRGINNKSPFIQNWYKDSVFIDPTWNLNCAVLVLDRGGQNSGWFYLYSGMRAPLTDVTGTNATYANNGERFQRDVNGNMYLAFTSGNPDSVYFSESTDGGAHWTKEVVAEGSYPVLALYGIYLHLLWIEDKDTDHAKLMYAWKSVTDQNFSTAECLLNINTDPTIESVGSPSLAVSRDSVFVTWESGMSPPLALTHGLYMGSLPNTRTPSPPFNYQMLDSGNSIHHTFPFGTDTIIQLQTPSIAVSKTKNPYIVWDRLDNITHCFDIVSWKRELGIWTKEIVSNTASWKDEVEPYLTYEDGVLHCVWSGTENNGSQPFNIYHSQKTPGQFGTGWSIPETVNNSQVHSFTPVYESGNAIWSEDNTWIMIQTYDSDSFDWQTSPPETIAKADSEYNMNPIATSGDDSLFTVWSNEDRFSNFYIHYDERSMLIPPLFAANLGDLDPSPFTVERNGRIVHGNSYYKTVDYDSNALVYEIRDLEPKPGQHFKLALYHEGNANCKLRVKVDNTWTSTVWVPPSEPFSVEGTIPMPCLVDSQIDITIESLQPANAHAVCSAFWIYDKANGGPMLSGEETAPFIYSLKTACPNPFKGNTTIYYAIEKPGIVSLKVYDITGRCIKTLENGIKDPGRYSVKWNGCDNKNHKVATGVYFTRLASENFTSTKKVILVR